MAAYEDRDIFVHCVANVRVTVFVALDRVIRQGGMVEAARATMRDLDLPDVWRAFVDGVLDEYRQ